VVLHSLENLEPGLTLVGQQIATRQVVSICFAKTPPGTIVVLELSRRSDITYSPTGWEYLCKTNRDTCRVAFAVLRLSPGLDFLKLCNTTTSRCFSGLYLNLEGGAAASSALGGIIRMYPCVGLFDCVRTLLMEIVSIEKSSIFCNTRVFFPLTGFKVSHHASGLKRSDRAASSSCAALCGMILEIVTLYST